MVAEDIRRTKRSKMHPKSLLPYTRLPEGEEDYYNNTQHQHGKGNNQGITARFMLRTGTVEYWIRPSNQSPIYKAHKSNGLRRWFLLRISANSVGKAENIANVELKKSQSGREKIIWDSVRGNQRWCCWPEGKNRTKSNSREYLNNKVIPQMNCLKYFRIIFVNKLTFKENINNMAEKCTKLIFSLW